MSNANPGKEQNEKRSATGPKISYGAVALIVVMVAYVSLVKHNVQRISSNTIDGRAKSVNASMNAHGRTTFQYWSQVKSIVSSHRFPSNAATQEVIVRLRGIGRSIQQLPTLGVDDEAVDYAQTVTETCDQIADLAESNSSIGKMAEHFLRGLNGDVISSFQEVNAQSEQVTQWIRNAGNKGNRVRALLTSRYGVEFPCP